MWKVQGKMDISLFYSAKLGMVELLFFLIVYWFRHALIYSGLCMYLLCRKWAYFADDWNLFSQWLFLFVQDWKMSLLITSQLFVIFFCHPTFFKEILLNFHLSTILKLNFNHSNLLFQEIMFLNLIQYLQSWIDK